MGFTRTAKMKKLPPLWGLGTFFVVILIVANFIFVRDMHWNYIVALFFMLLQTIFLACYWLVYAHNKSPAKASIYLMIWFILGSLYRFLTWPPAPVESYFFFDFPASSSLVIMYLAMSQQKVN